MFLLTYLFEVICLIAYGYEQFKRLLKAYLFGCSDRGTL